MAKKKKKRLKLFYPIYWTLIIAALAAIFVLCRNITTQLEDYEASQPKYAAEEVAKMFLERDFERVYSFQNPADFAGEDAATYAAYMTAFTEGQELTWGESYSSSEDEMVYAIRMDGKRLFEFSMIKGEPVNGHDTWKLNEVRTMGVSTTTHTVTAPFDSTVYVGGRELTADDRIEEGIPTGDEDFLLNDEAQSPTMSVYQYEVCFGKPEIRVVDAKGKENPVTIDEGGNASAARNSDDDIKAEAEERVVEIVKAFARFSSEDLTKRNMLKLVRKGTNAYENIDDFDNEWFGKHDGYDFGEIVTDNYVRLSEDTFGCDIHFDYIIEYDDADNKVYPTNYRFYFVERDDQWYLYDFRMISG